VQRSSHGQEANRNMDNYALGQSSGLTNTTLQPALSYQENKLLYTYQTYRAPKYLTDIADQFSFSINLIPYSK